MKFYRNKKGGSGTVELAPALVVIFIVILIPMLDLLYLGLAYACGWYCNHLVVREVACRRPVDQVSAETDAKNAWAASSLARFIGAKATDVTNAPITFRNDPLTGNPISVTVTTVVKVQPFLPIPFFMKVDGLNAPISFGYSAERPQEEKGIQ